jgi:hypothetical protein
MHFYLYEIRNNINSKIYVGVHKTKVLDDGYMGSGKIITRAIEKYGVENFTKTILETFETQEEMFAREKELVNEEFLLREDTYNLRRGGLGGWDYINTQQLAVPYFTKETTILVRDKSIAGLRNKLSDPVFYAQHIEKSIRAGKSVKNRKKHTVENIVKMTLLCQGKQTGEKNSQFGSMWITNGKESKKIKKTDPIPEGWNKGRVLKVK